MHEPERPVESHPMEGIITNPWMAKPADIQIIQHWEITTIGVQVGSLFEKVFGYGHSVHEYHVLSKDGDRDKATWKPLNIYRCS